MLHRGSYLLGTLQKTVSFSKMHLISCKKLNLLKKNLNEASFSPKTAQVLMRFTVHCGQLDDFEYRLQLLFRMLYGYIL